MTPGSRFATTSWSIVLAAREASTVESLAALEALCRAYWYPVYAFVRRQGVDAEEARDLTQAYFARLLEKGYLEDYEPERGRFRVFLKASVRHFLSKEREKARSWKRGGRAGIISLDDQQIEGRYRFEPVDRLTPEQLYERRWALTVLEQARARLREERIAAGRELEFRKLEGFLTGQGPQDRYKDIAAELGTTEDAVKQALHRLRRQFGALLRDVIGATVSSRDEVDDELRYLLGVISP
jgi:RNA polymerase sigma-70 factor (ECF subfamily)